MLFLEWKCMNCYYDFTEVCSEGSNLQYSSIGSDNGLAPARRQAIIWTNVHWRIFASLGLNELSIPNTCIWQCHYVLIKKGCRRKIQLLQVIRDNTTQLLCTVVFNKLLISYMINSLPLSIQTIIHKLRVYELVLKFILYEFFHICIVLCNYFHYDTI